LAARVREPKTGRVLEIYTTEPGVRFYTGNFLDGSVSGKGAVYAKRTGFGPEAQNSPDSVHDETFPSTILRPGEIYTQTIIYKFSAARAGPARPPAGAAGGTTGRVRLESSHRGRRLPNAGARIVPRSPQETPSP
jgi:hypothetical protein